MERAILDLGEQYNSVVKRIDDIEWKIESTQTYKNNKCESVVKLLNDSESVNRDVESLSEELAKVNSTLDEKRSKLRNAYQNHTVQFDALKRNIEKYCGSPRPN